MCNGRQRVRFAATTAGTTMVKVPAPLNHNPFRLRLVRPVAVAQLTSPTAAEAEQRALRRQRQQMVVMTIVKTTTEPVPRRF